MCGITGIWNFKESVNLEELKSFNDSLEKRGPDYGEETLLHEGRLGLGHRRLSILDLSKDGNQPMKKGRYTIVFNGEIFNYLELKKELISKGYAFTTKTDTEVVIYALDFWGKEALNKFNGMWAFALWDEKVKELLLSRDRFGIKPLFYSTMENNYFAFASQTIAFKEFKKADRSYDFDSVKMSWSNPYVLDGIGKTIFKGIQGLLPGHNLTIKQDGKIEKQERWWFPENFLVKQSPDYDTQKEQYKNLFLDACKIRLRSDVPLASALSGGVDSTAVYSGICEITKNLSKEPYQCFIGSFPNTEQDETEHALNAVNFANGNYELVTVNNQNKIDEIVSITKWYDSISSVPFNGISMVYETMKNNDFVISLDGHGPDELFFGYHDLMENSMQYAIWNLPFSYAKNMIEGYASRFENSEKIEKQLLIELGKSGSGLKDKLYKHLNKKALNKGIEGETIYSQSDLSNNAYDFESLIEPLKNPFNSFYLSSLPGILKSIDHISMFSSIEVRSPFLDYRLINFTSSLPLKSKVGNGYNKRIIRESMEGIMSPLIAKRTSKKGFSSPLLSWMKESNDVQEFVMDNLLSQKAKNLPFEALKQPDFKNLEIGQATEMWKRANLILLQNE